MSIFILEKNGDCSVYKSISEAQSAIESPDINSGEYIKAFDDAGNVYSIELRGDSALESEVVSPRAGILKLTNSSAAEELFNILWSRLHPSRPREDTNLRFLVDAALTHSEVHKSRYLPPAMIPLADES
jgi:hypothetical protein